MPRMNGKIHKISNPEITMEPFAPLAKEQKLSFDTMRIISAYETHDDVLKKYHELVEATHGIEPTDSPVEERESE